jgi:hypothetical protein
MEKYWVNYYIFRNYCNLYRKIVNNKDTENLHIDLNRMGEWAVENAIIYNPTKSMAVYFTRARVKEPLSYSLRDMVIPEASICKYLGIILSRDFSWADQVNCMVKKRLEDTPFCNVYS